LDTTQQESFKKNVVQVWKITIFDRQTVRHTALFNGASMEAIPSEFSEVR
jgi:hypothetical protein